MNRQFHCIECGTTAQAAPGPGRLPQRCDLCNPERAQRQRQANHPHTLRARIRELEVRIFELEGVLNGVPSTGVGSKEGVTRAVRRVAYAQGNKETRERLLDLAATAQAWARLLAVNPSAVEIGEARIDKALEKALP